MPGILTSIFDGNHGGDDNAGPQAAGHSDSYEAGLDQDTHLDPSITISNSMSGSYETPDGTTHSWERTDSVTLETDTHIVTQVSAVLTDEGDATY